MTLIPGSCIMLEVAGLVVAASLVVGQAEAKEAEKPEYNPHLEPLAWMIGEWEATTKTGTGEIKQSYRDTYAWTADKQAIILDVTCDNADGSRNFAGHVVFYWDPAIRRLAYHGVFTGNGVETGFLEKTDGTGFTWNDRYVTASGNQGHFTMKIGHKEGEDSFTRGWSKVSGTGPRDLGPHLFKRVK